jgi:hypothetical protein
VLRGAVNMLRGAVNVLRGAVNVLRVVVNVLRGGCHWCEIKKAPITPCRARNQIRVRTCIRIPHALGVQT